jgi:hypothetical protein
MYDILTQPNSEVSNPSVGMAGNQKLETQPTW